MAATAESQNDKLDKEFFAFHCHKYWLFFLTDSFYLVIYLTMTTKVERGIAAGPCHRGSRSILTRQLRDNGYQMKSKFVQCLS